MTTSYVAIDIETTGLVPRKDKITEIAALKVVEGQIQDRFATLVNPGRQLERRIVELTGITDEMVSQAPKIQQVIPNLADFCQGFPLLGHHVIFDYSFLKQAAVNSRLELEDQGIDTLKLCRSFMPVEVPKNLAAACAYFQIPQNQAHRALADALSAHFLYQELLKRYGAQEPGRFVPGPLIYKAKREQPATKRQKDYLRDLLKCHRIDVTVQIDSMSRSEASRMIDQIISQYGRMSRNKEVN